MAELFLNPGFENWTGGLPDDWNASVAGGSTINDETGFVYEGSHCARFDIDAGNNAVQIYQDKILVAGIRYLFSIYRCHSAAGKTLKLMIRDSGSNVYVQSNGDWAAAETWLTIPNVEEWLQYLFEFQTHPSYTNYRIYIRNDDAASSSIFVDTASLIRGDEEDTTEEGYPPDDVVIDDTLSQFNGLSPYLVWNKPIDLPDIYEIRTEDANWGQESSTLVVHVPGKEMSFEWTSYKNWCDSQELPVENQRVITLYIKARDKIGTYSLNADSVVLTNPVPDATDISLSAKVSGIGVNLSWSKSNIEADLSKWLIYRNTTNNSGTAVLMDERSIEATSYFDSAVSAGTTYYYWLKVKDAFDQISVNFSGIASILFTPQVAAISFQQIEDAAVPAQDGTLAFCGAPVLELDDCDAVGNFAIDSAVTGSVLISQELTDFKEGVGGLRVELWRYPARRYFDEGTVNCNIGYTGYKYRAQGFKPGATFTCAAVGLKLKKVGAPGNLTVAIYDNGVAGPNNLLCSGTITAAQVATTYGTFPKDYIFAVMDVPTALTLNTLYWVVAYTAATSSVNYYVTKRSSSDLFGDASERMMAGDSLVFLTNYPNYDMDFKACVAGDALNKYIYSTFAAKDISAKTYMRSWIKATRSGGFLSHAFGEAAISEQLFALTLANPDVWEWQSSNISAVPVANRDAVTKAGWKITNMDEDIVLRLDYLVTNLSNPTLKLRYGGGNLVSCYPPEMVEPRLRSVFYEEFFTLTGAAAPVQCTYPWNYAGLLPAMIAGRNGDVRFAGDGTTAPSANPIPQGTGLPWIASLNPIMAVRQAQYGAAAGTRRFGLGSAVLTTAPANGIYVQHGNGGNYIFVCRASSVESTLDSGIAAANGVFHELKMVITAALVTCYVDNVEIGTINSNIPTAALYFDIANSVNTVNNGNDIDYVYISQDRQSGL